MYDMYHAAHPSPRLVVKMLLASGSRMGWGWVGEDGTG